jgi:hypothetical protein
MRIILILILVLPLAAAATTGDEPEIAEEAMGETRTLLDFSESDEVEWIVVNDGVMGGRSRSAIRRSDGGTGVFAGELSLENSGGFASARALIGPTDLSAWDGLEIRVKGDGRTYQLRLRTDGRFDGVAYRASFATRDREWLTVAIRFADFEPTFRGRTLLDVPSLDPARVQQVGFLLADKRPGPFTLEIDFVRTWEDRP